MYTDFRTIRAFLTVAREGHVTRAAEKLYLTQPAVTLQLKRLARDSGLTLFRRTAFGVELTREGALLASKAEQVMAALVDFDRTAGHLANRLRGTLRIGTIIDPEFTRLGAFLRALLDGGSGVETTLRHGMSGDVIERLRDNQIDVGFVLGDGEQYLEQSPKSKTRFSDKNCDKNKSLGTLTEPSEGKTDPSYPSSEEGAHLFYKQALAQLTYRIIAPASLKNLVQGADWETLFSLPWIGTPPQSAHNRLCNRIGLELGIRQNIVARVDQEASIISMVRAGIGLGLARESMALHEVQSHGIALADRVKIPTMLNFICLFSRRDDPVIMAAFEAIRRVWH